MDILIGGLGGKNRFWGVLLLLWSFLGREMFMQHLQLKGKGWKELLGQNWQHMQSIPSCMEHWFMGCSSCTNWLLTPEQVSQISMCSVLLPLQLFLAVWEPLAATAWEEGGTLPPPDKIPALLCLTCVLWMESAWLISRLLGSLQPGWLEYQHVLMA